jgi:hypothetical protein
MNTRTMLERAHVAIQNQNNTRKAWPRAKMKEPAQIVLLIEHDDGHSEVIERISLPEKEAVAYAKQIHTAMRAIIFDGADE